MRQLFLELTKEDITNIFGGEIEYKWVYDGSRYIQIPVNS